MLDLHYLLTFHGDDADLVPQLLLGAVALRLHAEPVLTRSQVALAAAQETGSGAFGHFLANSDLAEQSELVRITPANLSLDEMNKLWMTFPQVDYVLSAVYVASVVLIETTDVLPGPASASSSRSCMRCRSRRPTSHRSPRPTSSSLRP